MIIYNVTVKVDHEIHNDWLHWMRNTHIPDVLNTGMFVSHRIARMIDPADKDGFTYAIQYYSNSILKIQKYQEEFAPKLQEEHTKRYKDKFVAFRTLLKLLD